MHSEAQQIVDRLRLRPHPEGGYYRETWRSPFVVTGSSGQARAASTAIFFLLPASEFSSFHRVRSDEVWHFYLGDPVDLYLIEENGRLQVHRVGHALEDGELPQAIVPAGVWQAARPRGHRFSLVGATVAPGFDFADFELPSRAELAARFPQHRDLFASLCRR